MNKETDTEKTIRLLDEINSKLDMHPDISVGNLAPRTSCNKCGLKFTDSMGRPLMLGYVCGDVECPCGFGWPT